jgi:hypothetical protein
MLILVDARPLQHIGPDDERAHFILSCLRRLVEKGGNEWIFLIDKKLGWSRDRMKFEVLAQRVLPGRVGWKWWYGRQVPKLMRDHSPDIFVSTSGIAAGNGAGVRDRGGRLIPQCLWMPVRIQEGPDAVYGPIYKRRWMKSADSAQSMLCFSEKDRGVLEGGVADKIGVLTPAPEEGIIPMTWEEKEKVKTELTGGREYFFSDLSLGSRQEAVGLLKAFSIFKKRQHSNLRLVLTGEPGGRGEPFHVSLASYKYRQEVHWFRGTREFRGTEKAAGLEKSGDPNRKDLERMMGACYGLILPFREDGLGIHLLNAWKARVPVIARGRGAHAEEVAGEGGALMVKEDKPDILAAALMRIYTDEGLRGLLMDTGTERLGSFTEERPLAEIERMWGKG